MLTATAKQELATNVATWLNGLHAEYAAVPVFATINGTEYAGSRYTNRDGNPALYCVGQQPKKGLSRPNKTCFDMGGETWYVSCYWEGHDADLFGQHHPFGRNFCMLRYSPDDQIDRYEDKPYDRKPMTVRDI